MMKILIKETKHQLEGSGGRRYLLINDNLSKENKLYIYEKGEVVIELRAEEARDLRDDLATLCRDYF